MQAWWVLALLSILLSSAGQLSLKYGLSLQSLPEGFFGALPLVLRSPFVLAGIAAYGASMLLWLAVLAKAELSLAYPMVSLSYVLVALGAALFLREALSFTRVLGILVIVLGVLLVTR